MQEDWKPIINYSNFLISNFGNVKNNRLNSIKIPQIDNKGYLKVRLYKKEGSKNFRIHRLVALHFIDNPNNYNQVDHIDRNKTNNNINNLRWCSCEQNCRNTKKQLNTTSKYKGVHYCIRNKKWVASTSFKKKQIHLGYYLIEEDAYNAYKKFIDDNNLNTFYSL